MSSYLQSKCSSSIQSGYSCIPGIVILTHLGFFPPFISFVRTGSLPSFTIVCFCQLYEETLFWLFLSIFLPESQHFVPLLFDGVFKNTLLFFLVWISVAECFCILVNSSNPKNSSAKFQNHKLSETGFLQLRLSYDLKTKPRVVKLT